MDNRRRSFATAPVWKPNDQTGKNIRKLMKTIENKYNVKFDDYWDFHKWTVENIPEFWAEMWDYSGIIHSQKYNKVIDMGIPISESPEWFEGAKLNYAENLLKYRDDKVAFIVAGEEAESYKVTFAELYEKAKIYAAAFRKFGIRKGDIVMCYMSNRIEAIYGMLAAVSIGAVWTGALPQMGPEAVLNRVSQVQPKLLLTVDRFVFNREETDMLPKIKEIAEALACLDKVVIVPSNELSKERDISEIRNGCFVDDFLELGREEDGSIPEMQFEQVSVSHPVFINFTSGTTGLPKGLIHGSGCILSISRDYSVHMDTKRGDVFLSVSPVGWASWCIFGSVIFSGLTVLLYEGSPFFLSKTAIWDLVDEFKISHLFITATIIDELDKQRCLPTEKHSLKSLRLIMAAASVVKLRSYDFVYEELKLDVLYAGPYGSTEVMGCIATMDFTLPVHKGESPAPVLGSLLECYDETTGKSVEGVMGEIVSPTPTPAFVVNMLGDTDGSKMREKYYSKYPGKFTVGDNGIINPITKGLIICGRSDDTLKQRGCRFGSSEIYNVVEHFSEVHDSLCVSQYNKDLDERAVLFLKMKEGQVFTQNLVTRIRDKIAHDLTPRHVPDVIIETQEIPFNTNGKKMEILVKKIINNMSYNNDAIGNPESLKYYRNRPELQGDF